MPDVLPGLLMHLCLLLLSQLLMPLQMLLLLLLILLLLLLLLPPLLLLLLLLLPPVGHQWDAVHAVILRGSCSDIIAPRCKPALAWPHTVLVA